MDKQTLEKLNILLQCDPTRCQYSNCPLYFDEVKKCDAKRFITMLTAILQIKFKDTPTYDPCDPEE